MGRQQVILQAGFMQTIYPSIAINFKVWKLFGWQNGVYFGIWNQPSFKEQTKDWVDFENWEALIFKGQAEL